MRQLFFGPQRSQAGPHSDRSTIETAEPTGAATKTHPRLIAGLAACGFFLIAAIACVTAIAIFHLRDRALSHTQRELENVALVLAAKTNGIFENIEHIQSSLIERMRSTGMKSSEDFERIMSGYEVHLMLKDKSVGLPYLGTFTLINAQGKLFNFSRSWPIPNIDVSDREYFKVFRSQEWRKFFISEPIQNRATGTWVVQFARKITTSEGEFAGLLLAAIELDRLENDFQSVVLGEHGSISLFRSNGTLVARSPHSESNIGQKFTGAIDGLKGRSHGTVRLLGRMDGKDRILAVHALTNYPFFISVGWDVSASLSTWEQESKFLIGFGLLSSALITAVFFLIVREFARNDKRSEQRLALEKQRLDIAINNMTQGLLLFDSLTQIVVCNQRYLTMYGLSPEVVKPGCMFRELIEHRKETGTFVGDLDEYCSRLASDLAQGKVTQTLVETADGRLIQIVNQPLANGGWVATHEDITERTRSEKQIAHLAHYDALTDLPNRVLFREQLEQSIKWCHRGERLAVLYLDLDHFKSVNDTLGHPAGDELLKAVAARLRDCLRETDTVARLGGDEFAIIQTAVDDPQDTTGLVARIFETIRQPYDCAGHQVTTDVSVGIALAPADGTDPDQLLKNADLALYGAKADGRGTYRFFEPSMDARVKARRALEFDLRQAVMCNGLELYYQPVVNLQNSRIVACEALLRWHHPVRGMISPEEFIPVAEETGLINVLSEWVLKTACAQAATWPAGIKVAINISPVQFKSGALALTVVSALAESNIGAERLELEITEAVLIRDDETALATLYQLRDLGVRIAMDDFGTGYSSLSYLQRFPFDKIKIDRCFIKDVAEDAGSFAIVQAVIAIAKSRNLITTAEGVETKQQLEILRTLGCTEMQGFLFSPAKPAADITRLLTGRKDKTTDAA